MEASDSGNTEEILKCLTKAKPEEQKEGEKTMKTINGLDEDIGEMEMLRRDSRFLSTH